MYLDTGKTTHSAGFTGLFNTVVHRVGSAARALKRSFDGHRAARRMADLDDRMLDDIGLSRADVERALISPILSDPRVDLATARWYRINAKRWPIRRR